jgi:O-antigen ligase
MGKRSREKKEMQEEGYKPEISENTSTPWLWRLIFIGTCFVLFTPFVISGKYFFPFVGLKSIYFMGVVEIIFAAWLILMIYNKKYRPRLNAVTVALILFLAVQVASSLAGVDFLRSFWSKYERMTGLLMQIHLFGFFLVVSSCFKKREDWLKIFGVSIFSAVLMSIMNLFPVINTKVMGQMASVTRGGATIGNSSFLGTYLLFNFFFALYSFLNSKNWFKIFSIFSFIVIGVALYFSTARAALLSTIGGLVLFVLAWLILARGKKSRILGIAISAILVLAVALSTYLAFKPGNIVNKIVSENVGTTLGGRLPVWQSAWQGFKEKPLLGWGPENFEIVFTKYFNPCLFGPNCGADIWYDRAHDIVFDTLAATGILGLISYLGIFAVIFYVLWRKFSQHSITFWAAGVFSVTLIAYFVQNLTVFDMVNSYMLLFLTFAFVGSVASEREDDKKENEERPIKLIVAILIIALFVYPFMKSVIAPAQASRNTIVALGYEIGTEQKLATYQKTLALSPVGIYQLRDFFAQNAIEELQSKDTSKLSVEGVKKDLNFLAQEMEISIKESPWDFRSYLKLGQLYNFYTVLIDTSKLSRADQVLQKAIEVSPTNQQGYWSLAQTKIYEGQMQEALSLAEKAVNLEPQSRQSNLIVIQIAKIMGNNELVQQKVEAALKADPSLEADINSLLGK